MLARRALGWDKATYLTKGQGVAPEGFLDRFLTMLRRRERREPVSLITGHREFWGLDFEVTRDVLTPRPETEILVELAMDCLRAGPTDPVRFVDVGTGSGCIAVTVATVAPDVQITATDVSAAALRVAQRNAARHGVGERIRWVNAPLLGGVSAPLDLVVANLPYVPTRDIEGLPPEVREFEPLVALAGGDDGLEVIGRLLDETEPRLRKGGHLVLEFGVDQEAPLRDRVAGHPRFDFVDVRGDLQGIPRAAVIQAGV